MLIAVEPVSGAAQARRVVMAGECPVICKLFPAPPDVAPPARTPAARLAREAERDAHDGRARR